MKIVIVLVAGIVFSAMHGSDCDKEDATPKMSLCSERGHEQLFSYVKEHNCLTDGYVRENKQIITQCGEFLEKHKDKDKIDFQYSCYTPETRYSLSYLSYACFTLTCGAEVVELLCQHGADPNLKRSDGLYPATCYLLAIVRLYEKKHVLKENVWNALLKNQRQKFDLLYAAAMNVHDEYVRFDLRYKSWFRAYAHRQEIANIAQCLKIEFVD